MLSYLRELEQTWIQSSDGRPHKHSFDVPCLADTMESPPTAPQKQVQQLAFSQIAGRLPAAQKLSRQTEEAIARLGAEIQVALPAIETAIVYALSTLGRRTRRPEKGCKVKGTRLGVVGRNRDGGARRVKLWALDL